MRRVVEVSLDRRGRAAEAPSDLGDREALRVAEVTCQRHTAAAPEHAVISARSFDGRHAMEAFIRRKTCKWRYCSDAVSSSQSSARRSGLSGRHSFHERTSTSAEDSSSAPGPGQLRSSCSALPRPGAERHEGASPQSRPLRGQLLHPQADGRAGGRRPTAAPSRPTRKRRFVCWTAASRAVS